jgi:hypothetical protein
MTDRRRRVSATRAQSTKDTAESKEEADGNDVRVLNRLGPIDIFMYTLIVSDLEKTFGA